MKLKRTVALIMGTVLSMASLAGCSQTTLNYGEELAKTAKWEATSSEVTGKISMDIQQEIRHMQKLISQHLRVH